MVGWRTPLISNLYLLWRLRPPTFILQLPSLMGACFTSAFPFSHNRLAHFVATMSVHDLFCCSSSRDLFCRLLCYLSLYSLTPLRCVSIQRQFPEGLRRVSDDHPWSFRVIAENTPDMEACKLSLCTHALLCGDKELPSGMARPGRKIFWVAATVRWALELLPGLLHELHLNIVLLLFLLNSLNPLKNKELPLIANNCSHKPLSVYHTCWRQWLMCIRALLAFDVRSLEEKPSSLYYVNHLDLLSWILCNWFFVIFVFLENSPVIFVTVITSSSSSELADLVVEGDWDVPELFSMWHLSATSSDSLTFLTWSSQDSSESVQVVLWCFCDSDSHYKPPFYWLELFILNATILITFVFGRRLEPNCIIHQLAINLDFNFSSSCSYITSPCGRLFLPAF